MTERCFISLAEIPGIRRQLKSSTIVINKLTESELKSCALLASGSLHPRYDELDFHSKCEISEPKKEIPLDMKDEALIGKVEKKTRKTQQKLKRKLRNSEATETKWSVEKGKTGGNEEDRSPVKKLRLKISSTSDTSSMAHSKKLYSNIG